MRARVRVKGEGEGEGEGWGSTLASNPVVEGCMDLSVHVVCGCLCACTLASNPVVEGCGMMPSIGGGACCAPTRCW